MSPSSDYVTVARVLRFLEENARRQPTLDEAAAHAGMSPSHFQRLFTRWAGVSPKRFLQFLTVEHAKGLLRESEPVLQASLASGLSGPARLHDLFVSTEGVTPGEFKSRGRELEIRYGTHPTPFGPALLAATDRGICHLAFVEDHGQALDDLSQRWSGASLREHLPETASILRRIFPGDDAPPPTRPLSLFLKGTNFQIKVWNALLRVPPGALTTYGRLAGALGNHSASRAVGTAVGANPIAYLIPCHRVIREMGTFGQYRWGAVRKQAILGWEAARRAS